MMELIRMGFAFLCCLAAGFAVTCSAISDNRCRTMEFPVNDIEKTTTTSVHVRVLPTDKVLSIRTHFYNDALGCDWPVAPRELSSIVENRSSTGADVNITTLYDLVEVGEIVGVHCIYLVAGEQFYSIQIDIEVQPPCPSGDSSCGPEEPSQEPSSGSSSGTVTLSLSGTVTLSLSNPSCNATSDSRESSSSGTPLGPTPSFTLTNSITWFIRRDSTQDHILTTIPNYCSAYKWRHT
jgi:hypothetical protein